MSLSFPFVPKGTYFVTFSCSERRFFLKPSAQVRQVFLFCLLRAAKKYGIKVHAFCVLSNHCHMVVTDPDVSLPDFMSWLKAQSTRCLNVFYGRTGPIWEDEPYGRARVLGDEALIDKLVYTITNPLSSGLVRRPEQWPGLVSSPEDIGSREFEVKRPSWYFRKNGPVPATVSGMLSVPPQFAHLSLQEFVTLLRDKVEERIRELHDALDKTGRTCLGTKRVLRRKIGDTPRTPPPRSKLNPRVVCKDSTRRVAALRALKAFYQAYREAFLAYRNGDKNVLFPRGTFWMRVHASVRCEAFAPT